MQSTKELNKRIIFLQDACTKDGKREQLDRVNIDDRNTTATNGFKLHAIETPEEVKERGCYMVNNGKVRAADQFINLHDPTEKEFPDFSQVLPIQNGDGCTIGINAKMLSDTLKHFDAGVIIKIKAPTQPVEIFGTVQGHNAYALIMPMYIEADSYTWRPE